MQFWRLDLKRSASTATGCKIIAQEICSLRTKKQHLLCPNSKFLASLEKLTVTSPSCSPGSRTRDSFLRLMLACSSHLSDPPEHHHCASVRQKFVSRGSVTGMERTVTMPESLLEMQTPTWQHTYWLRVCILTSFLGGMHTQESQRHCLGPHGS